MKTHTKNWILVLTMVVAVAVIAGCVIGSGVLRHRVSGSQTSEIAGIVLPQPQRNIQPFHFMTTDNQSFTEKDLQGHWTLVFFGFTHCGMVCPTTMASLNTMYQTLQSSLPEEALPRVVMVTVDPERDTLERLTDYVGAFNKNFIGARADIAETVALEKQLHIAAAKIQADTKGANHYTIDHSSEVLLFNPAGELQAYLTWPHEAGRMAQDYRAIVTRKETRA